MIVKDQCWSPKWYKYFFVQLWVDFNFYFLLLFQVAFFSRYSKHILIHTILSSQKGDATVILKIYFVLREKKDKKRLQQQWQSCCQIHWLYQENNERELCKRYIKHSIFCNFDQSTGASIFKQEELYVLFLPSNGVPVLKFLSVNNLKLHTPMVLNNVSKILFNVLE